MKKETRYVSTPIYYVNAAAHLGHAYSTVIADTIARYSRLKGHETFFLTGTDEHGEKVAISAALKNKKPKEFCDEVSASFKAVWKKFDISYDKFIRTTDEEHKKGVQKAFELLEKNGDIYKGEYVGYYCVSCETQHMEKALIDNEFCPDCNKPVELKKEESYFFILSNYEDKLLKFYEENPNWIVPKSRAKEVISFVKEGLIDLSISRSSFDWGVKIPEYMNDPKHVMYVWLDALFNYVTALGYNNDFDDNMHFWREQNTIHVIGKDILRFHAVYWPAFLMSIGLPLPKHIATHGWWTRNGEKMSKSKGNVVEPVEVADAYGVDNFRYFMLREVPFGGDGDFSQDALIARINGELASGLGNLVNRMIGLSRKYTDYMVDSIDVKKYYSDELEEVHKLLATVEEYYESLTFHKMLEQLWKPLALADGIIQNNIIDNKEKNSEEIMATIALVATILSKVSIFLHPVMPKTTEKIAQLLGFSITYEAYERYIKENKLLDVVKLSKIDTLFPKVEKPLLKAVKIETTKKVEEVVTHKDFTKSIIKVGKVLEAKEIKSSNKMLQLQVDIGEENPRQIIAGIKKSYSVEDIVNRLVLVVSNLESKQIMGFESQGMLLMAQQKNKMVLVTPEKDIELGSIIS